MPIPEMRTDFFGMSLGYQISMRARPQPGSKVQSSSSRYQMEHIDFDFGSRDIDENADPTEPFQCLVGGDQQSLIARAIKFS